jgi:hypothetical protein
MKTISIPVQHRHIQTYNPQLTTMEGFNYHCFEYALLPNGVWKTQDGLIIHKRDEQYTFIGMESSSFLLRDGFLWYKMKMIRLSNNNTLDLEYKSCHVEDKNFRFDTSYTTFIYGKPTIVYYSVDKMKEDLTWQLLLEMQQKLDLVTSKLANVVVEDVEHSENVVVEDDDSGWETE